MVTDLAVLSPVSVIPDPATSVIVPLRSLDTVTPAEPALRLTVLSRRLSKLVSSSA